MQHSVMAKGKAMEMLFNKYNHLLLLEVLLIIGYPFFSMFRFPVIFLLMVLALIPPLYMGLGRKSFVFMLVTISGAFSLHLMWQYNVIAREISVLVVLFSLYSIFFSIAIMILIKKISMRTVVTSDTVKGGISVYFLIGLLWSFFYMILGIYDDNAYSGLNFSMANSSALLDCIYYSFTALTTLGFGDISPITSMARGLTMLESIVGQLYLAIFVAQLIGLKVASSFSPDRD